MLFLAKILRQMYIMLENRNHVLHLFCPMFYILLSLLCSWFPRLWWNNLPFYFITEKFIFEDRIKVWLNQEKKTNTKQNQKLDPRTSYAWAFQLKILMPERIIFEQPCGFYSLNLNPLRFAMHYSVCHCAHHSLLPYTLVLKLCIW